MSDRVAVLVVGAGPIGLTMACHLGRLGLNVRVIDKRSGPSIHSKAIGLQYRVSEVLARLGVVGRFVAAGGSPTTVNLYADRKTVIDAVSCADWRQRPRRVSASRDSDSAK